MIVDKSKKKAKAQEPVMEIDLDAEEAAWETAFEGEENRAKLERLVGHVKSQVAKGETLPMSCDEPK